MGALCAVLPGEEAFLDEHDREELQLVDFGLNDGEIVHLVMQKKRTKGLVTEMSVATDEGDLVGVIDYCQWVTPEPGVSTRRLVLRDSQQAVRALMLRRDAGRNAFDLYGLQPRAPGQEPAAFEGCPALFRWAQATEVRMQTKVKMKMMDDAGELSSEDRYVAESSSAADLTIVRGRDELGACLAKHSDAARGIQLPLDRYEVAVAPGIDVALMVCMVAMTDKLCEGIV